MILLFLEVAGHVFSTGNFRKDLTIRRGASLLVGAELESGLFDSASPSRAAEGRGRQLSPILGTASLQCLSSPPSLSELCNQSTVYTHLSHTELIL